MASQIHENGLSIKRRMEVFAALVKAQDSNLTVAQSRAATALQFGLTEQQILGIEQEGLEGEWPPLG